MAICYNCSRKAKWNKAGIQSIHFDVDSGWTKEKVRSWLENHPHEEESFWNRGTKRLSSTSDAIKYTIKKQFSGENEHRYRNYVKQYPGVGFIYAEVKKAQPEPSPKLTPKYTETKKNVVSVRAHDRHIASGKVVKVRKHTRVS